jgi:hypothetical protein
VRTSTGVDEDDFDAVRTSVTLQGADDPTLTGIGESSVQLLAIGANCEKGVGGPGCRRSTP